MLNRLSRLKKDAAFVYGGFLLRSLSLVILTIYYGRVLGPAQYGKVLAAMSLMGIVWLAVNYGFSTVGSRELAMAKDQSEHGHIFGRQIMGRIMLIPAGLLIGAGGTLLSPILSADPWYGILATALGFVNAINLGWFFQGLRKFRMSIFFEALAYPLNVIFILCLVKGENDGLRVLIGLLASYIICTILAYIFALRTLKTMKIIFHGGWQEIKDSSVIFLQSANSTLMTLGSTYVLSVMSNSEQVGYYGTVERFISVALAFLGPAGQVLMPTIAHRSVHAPNEMSNLVRKAQVFEIGYGICACIGGYLLAPVIPLAFGHKFLPSVSLMRIMVWLLPFCAFTHSFGLYVLIPQKKEKLLLIGVFIGNVVNFLLIALFAKSMGGKGVATARVAGEVLIAVFLLAISLRMRRARFTLQEDTAMADALVENPYEK